MSTATKEFYSVNDLVKATGLSRSVITRKIRDNEFVAINKEYYQRDRGYRFTKEEFERIVDEYKVEGLTTGQVAERIGYSITKVQQLIKEGKLPAIEKRFGSQIRRYVLEEDVESFIEKHGKRDNGVIYHQDSGYFLFQPLTTSSSQEVEGRIISLNADGTGTVMKLSNEKITLEQAIEEGFMPIVELEEKEPIYNKGWVVFDFPKPKYIVSPVYSVIERLFLYAGHQNLQIELDEEILKVKVKPVLLEGLGINNEVEEVQLIKSSIRKGIIIEHHKGLLIDSDLVNLSTELERRVRDKIHELVKEGKYSSIKEFIQLAVEEKLNREETVENQV